jgi:hypothetical protein
MQGMRTEQVGLADINAYYDPALSFEENMARILGAINTNNQDSTPYYGGGMIQNTDLVDEIDRLIRGY